MEKSNYLGKRGIVFGAFMTVLIVNGCAVIEPRLSPDQKKADAYANKPTLPNAVALAESLRVQYADKVENQILLDRAVGLTLIGAASAVGGLAATGGPTTPIIATMLGGGALFGVDSFLSSKSQQLIYASGANAIQCALDIMQPISIAYESRGRLQKYIDGSDDGKTVALESMIAEAEQLMVGGLRSPIYIRAEAAVQKARTILEPARKALGILNGSGAVLRASLSSIELQITNAIIANSPSVQALATSLGFSLPAIGKPLNIAPISSKTGKVALTSTRDEQDLLSVAQHLEQTVAVIESIIAQVNERPSVDKLKTCNINLEQTGLKMTLSPSSEISVSPPKGNVPVSVTIRASGGVLPYGAEWVGQTPPPEQINLSIESGQGIVTITINKGAEEAVYGLLIHDAANGSANTSVRISSTSVSTSELPTPAVQNTPAKTCVKDITIERIQNFLLQEFRKLEKDVNIVFIINGVEKKLVADGCYGEVTEAAIKVYIKDIQHLEENAFPQDQTGLINTMKDFLQ